MNGAGAREIMAAVGENENISFTLTRQQWSILLYLAGRGAIESMEHFVKNKCHTVECIAANADAVHALQELYKAAVPDAAATVATDQLKSEGLITE